MKIKYKSPEEIRAMRETSLVVAAILDEICDAVKPGISTWDLDRIAAEAIEREKVVSAFLGYYDYPAVLCTSVNEVVVHGIPRKDVILEDGDIIGIDFGVFKDRWCGDSARTVPVGTISEEKSQLVEATREALELGIQQCHIGNRLGDIAQAIQNHVEPLGFSVVRQFVGHGIGKDMHEDPPVHNFYTGRPGKRLKSGLVIAIEPMVNAGAAKVKVLEDEWTAVTEDSSMSAHFEHTVAITPKGPWVLSRASSTPGNPG